MKIFENWIQYYLWVWKYLMFKCLNCSNWMRLKQLTFVDSAQLTSFTEQQSKIDFYHFQFFVVVVQPSNKQQLSSQSPCTFIRQFFRQFFKSPCTFMKITLYNIIQQLARIILAIAFIFIMFKCEMSFHLFLRCSDHVFRYLCLIGPVSIITSVVTSP